MVKEEDIRLKSFILMSDYDICEIQKHRFICVDVPEDGLLLALTLQCLYNV